jgi:hypothetical protein
MQCVLKTVSQSSTFVGRRRDRQKAWGSTREASHCDDVCAFGTSCESLVIYLATPPFGSILARRKDSGRTNPVSCWPAVYHPHFLDYPNEFRLGTDVAERNLTGRGMLPKVVLEPRASNPIPINVTDSAFLSKGDVSSVTQNKNK